MDSAREGGADLSWIIAVKMACMWDSAREGGADLSLGRFHLKNTGWDSAREGGADLSCQIHYPRYPELRLRPRGRGGFKQICIAICIYVNRTPPARAGRI